MTSNIHIYIHPDMASISGEVYAKVKYVDNEELLEWDELLDSMYLNPITTLYEIYLEGKPFRTGRGSIYVDIMVPETDDKEFDREVAKKMLEYYSKQIKNENYVGGLGFKNQGNLIQPYDNMDF